MRGTYSTCSTYDMYTTYDTYGQEGGSTRIAERRAELASGEVFQGAEAGGEFGGVQLALAVEAAEKIAGGPFSFLRVAFDATRNQVAVGIAPHLHPRHDVVQALHRRRGPAHTVEALAALARVDGLAQRRVLQKVCLLDVNRRAGARLVFPGSGLALDAIQPLRANLLGQPHLHHVPRFAPLDQAHRALSHESAHRLAYRPRG